LLTAIDTVRQRLRLKVAFGDGGDAKLTSSSRAHANLAEHAPIVLIMMAALELAHANHKLLMGIAIAFLVARVAHVIGLYQYQPGSPKVPVARQVGVMLTWVTIAALGAWTALMLVNANLGH
jgi:uncharacterized membrane protein YecN with MAPEG domain